MSHLTKVNGWKTHPLTFDHDLVTLTSRPSLVTFGLDLSKQCLSNFLLLIGCKVSIFCILTLTYDLDLWPWPWWPSPCPCDINLDREPLFLILGWKLELLTWVTLTFVLWPWPLVTFKMPIIWFHTTGFGPLGQSYKIRDYLLIPYPLTFLHLF